MEREKHVQRLTKAENARAAGNAGTDLLRMYNMRNTNDYLHVKNTKRFKLQASSPKLRKHQATSLKPQAQRFKLQAASVKLTDRGPWIKFHGPRTKALDQDKTILRMCYVEGNLVW